MKELPLTQELNWNNIRNKKDLNVVFDTALSDRRMKSVEKDREKPVRLKAGRPKSAGSMDNVPSAVTDLKKRPGNSCGSRGELREKVWPDSEEEKCPKEFCCCSCCSCCCCQGPRFGCSNLLNLDSRSWSGWSLNASKEEQNELWARFSNSSELQRKCRSNPNFKKVSSKEMFEFHKAKKSPRLSDSGIPPGMRKNFQKRKPEEKLAKITHRSISSDSLKAAVKKVWIDNCFGESHRKLLAQAAYQDWYFKKERELLMKRNKERLTRLKAQENFKENFELKQKKSEEEFQKWLQKKIIKAKKSKKNFTQNQENSFHKLIRSKEESEKAYIKWKKSKEEELEKKKKEKRKEEEKRLQSEKEKREKKIIAEKAFQQWKIKLKENEKSEGAKKQVDKKRKKAQEKRKKERSQISFEAWKAAKDKQIEEKLKQSREAFRIEREKRWAHMEERMYEAEQAFEDWLEKVDLRKQKQFSQMNNGFNKMPWVPA